MMTICDFLEMSCDDSDRVTLYDFDGGDSITEEVDTLLRSEEYEEIVSCDIESWDYDRVHECICLNYSAE